MIHRSLRHFFVVAGACALLVLSHATLAGPPKSTVVKGIRLGDSPDAIVQWLKTNYPQCDQQQSVYRAQPGEKTGPLAIVAINEGTMNVCPGTPEGNDSTDIVIVRFAHPAVDENRGAFEVLVNRHYPDPLLTPRKAVRYTLDKVLAELRRQYGPPGSQHEERTTSQSAGHAASLGIASDAKRDDRLLRLLWSVKGKASDVRGDSAGHGYAEYECDCGDRFLVADIETSRSPQTRPANRAYVTRVSLFLRQADVRARQDAWNAQWLRLDTGSTPATARGAATAPAAK